MLGNVEAFLDRIFAYLDEAGIDVKAYPLDHLCYRVESEERYYRMCRSLLSSSKLLAETPINGRPISTFRLRAPIHYKGRDIDVVEIPAPKPGKVVAEGLEHVEFAVGDLETWLASYPRIVFKRGGSSLNPEASIEFGDCAVKFHPLPLDRVIAMETKEFKTHPVFRPDDLPELIELYKAMGWLGGSVDAAMAKTVGRALTQSYKVVTLRADGRLVGAGRMISDGVRYAHIFDVVVLPEFQCMGLGRQIMEELERDCGHMNIYLTSTFGKEAFYSRLKYKRHKTAFAKYPGPSAYLHDS